MKNKILFYSVTMFLFSINNWAQKKEDLLNEKKVDTTDIQKKMKVKYYYVEEIVPLKFGGHTTFYKVSKENLIQTYYLGLDGKRIITPVFFETPNNEIVSLESDSLVKLKNAKISISDMPKKTDSYAYIDIIKTYERVYDKGYESIDMLKKVANSYFFNEEFEKAEKCYAKLFAKTSDLEPEFYYRYAITLKAIGKNDLSNEYLKKYNLLLTNQ